MPTLPRFQNRFDWDAETICWLQYSGSVFSSRDRTLIKNCDMSRRCYKMPTFYFMVRAMN